MAKLAFRDAENWVTNYKKAPSSTERPAPWEHSHGTAASTAQIIIQV